MLCVLRPSPCLPLRRFLCKCSAPDMSWYREAFARRMAMAGIKPHHRIALGVSGGPDSMALCVLTAGWKLDGSVAKNKSSGFIDGLLGIVVDHRLRAASTEEAILVRDRVNKMGVKCEIETCTWSGGRPKHGHLQEAAREMRYQIFEDVCIKQHIGILLIAQHADDQAELLILRLSRNSGVLGLAGMAFVSQLFPASLRYGENAAYDGILLVRPILEFTKDDMYKICQGANQEWVEDPTNQSPLYARNRIRSSLRRLSSVYFTKTQTNSWQYFPVALGLHPQLPMQDWLFLAELSKGPGMEYDEDHAETPSNVEFHFNVKQITWIRMDLKMGGID
ncbi:PP-loop family [Musa troglodytarum]|uniref:tRNA(Ile)-lysidine synthetase n=1 Tax=Musa troglodytarum TaxID=320322 RepID=A0A9E7GH63_9LILI|nr:PP-loop family [Musa troglodytarum]